MGEGESDPCLKFKYFQNRNKKAALPQWMTPSGKDHFTTTSSTFWGTTVLEPRNQYHPTKVLLTSVISRDTAGPHSFYLTLFSCYQNFVTLLWSVLSKSLKTIAQIYWTQFQPIVQSTERLLLTSVSDPPYFFKNIYHVVCFLQPRYGHKLL